MSAVALVVNPPVPAGGQVTLPGVAKPLRLSHSRKQTMLTCGRKYRYVYVDRLEADAASYSLPFGGASHTALAQYVTAHALGAYIDPAEAFVRAWNEQTKRPIAYSSIWSEEGCRKTGVSLMEQFRDKWTELGWKAVLDKDGLPIVERELHVLLPGGVVWIAIIDAVVETPDGRILVLDFKTPGDASMPTFASISDQLLGYQVAVNANRETLGLTRDIDGLVFFELIKRPIPKTKSGTGPHIVVSEPAPPRSRQDVEEWIRECQFVARDIRDQRFARRPMDSYNTPCELCDFMSHCHSGISHGLKPRTFS